MKGLRKKSLERLPQRDAPLPYVQRQRTASHMNAIIQRVTARRLTVAAAALSIGTPLALVAADSASAARATQPPPAPAPTVVAAPSVFQILSSESNRERLAIDPGTGFGHEVQVISGPSGISGTDLVSGSPVTAFLTDFGWQVGTLVPSSDYVIRARRTSRFNFSTKTLGTVTSPWASFSFRTPSLAASRPSTPVLTLGSVTATTVTINWAPSSDNVSTETQIGYSFTRNGVNAGTTCQVYCFGATGLRIARPAPGTSVRIAVTAVDDAGIPSLASQEIVVNG